MDSTDSDPLRAALQAQGYLLHSQEERLNHLGMILVVCLINKKFCFAAVSDQIVKLAYKLQTPTPAAQPPPSPLIAMAVPTHDQSITDPVSVSPPRLARPENFSGDMGDCCPFLTQRELHFELQAKFYPTDHYKIAYIISQLIGQAEVGATVEW